MSDAGPTRETMRAYVIKQRATLQELSDRLSEADLQKLQVTPEWNGLDMLRHILTWNDLLIRNLQDWSRTSDRAPGELDFDKLNAQYVQERSHLGRDALIEQLNAAYSYYLGLIDTSSDTELAEQGLAPWGEALTRLQACGSVGHDAEHFEHIQAAIA